MKTFGLVKSMVIGLMLLTGATAVSAQDDNLYGIANRVGVGVGVGTEGIGFDVAVPLTKYVQARVGLNVMPNININTSADVASQAQGYNYEGQMDIKGKFSRTTFDVKFDCYPFANASSFFVTAGFSVGGDKLIEISGHSDDLQKLYAQGKQYNIEIGDYQIPVDEKGNVNGGVKVKNFRPYLGLGFGRLIPKKRFGARFEIGAQFQGKPVVYADGVGDLQKVIDQDADDDISKFMDWLQVYPVLKLSIRGRIL
ncbi:hypothetical protein [Prevotella sp.]|uniref:hypothetical protein n=1 Tax=Prevotella sp. TaxID=59823 RepID=UPI0027E3487C|nr:hypothetical protein [Prevotella sp.]